MWLQEEIRDKLMQHKGLRELVSVDRVGKNGRKVDEGVAVYLQMLRPRTKSPPRFPD